MLERTGRKLVKPPDRTVPGYTFLSTPKSPNFRPHSFVGFFTDGNKTKFVIKKYNYTRKNLDYEYLSNERSMLQLVNTLEFPRNGIGAPKLIASHNSGGQVIIQTEFAQGHTIDTLPKHKIIETLSLVIRHLRKLSGRLTASQLAGLPKRTPFLTFATLPAYTIRAYMKEHSLGKSFVYSLYVFYKYYFPILFGRYTLGLSHRDLHPDNVLYNSHTRTLTYLDLECMVIADELYDLALIPRLFARYLTAEDYIQLVKRQNLSKSETHRLIALILDGCIIKIATEQKNSRDYKDAIAGFTTAIREIIPGFRQSI